MCVQQHIDKFHHQLPEFEWRETRLSGIESRITDNVLVGKFLNLNSSFNNHTSTFKRQRVTVSLATHNNSLLNKLRRWGVS